MKTQFFALLLALMLVFSFTGPPVSAFDSIDTPEIVAEFADSHIVVVAELAIAPANDVVVAPVAMIDQATRYAERPSDYPSVNMITPDQIGKTGAQPNGLSYQLGK